MKFTYTFVWVVERIHGQIRTERTLNGKQFSSQSKTKKNLCKFHLCCFNDVVRSYILSQRVHHKIGMRNYCPKVK